MNMTDIEIKIPASIAAMKLPVAQKIVLAHIANFPGCSNARLAKLIGVSNRGVESLLRRLRRQGYIEPAGKGRARRHYLMFPVERHTECGDSNTKNSHTSGGVKATGLVVQPVNTRAVVLQPELSWQDDLDRTLDMIHFLCTECNPFPESIVNLYNRILKRLAEEAPDIPEKEPLVKELTRRRDGFVAISFGQRLPRSQQAEARRLISAATPEMLAEFRRRIEAGQVGHRNDNMLAALADAGRVASGQQRRSSNTVERRMASITCDTGPKRIWTRRRRG